MRRECLESCLKFSLLPRVVVTRLLLVVVVEVVVLRLLLLRGHLGSDRLDLRVRIKAVLQRNEVVDAADQDVGVLQIVVRLQDRRLGNEVRNLRNARVLRVRLHLLEQVMDDRVVGVNLENFLVLAEEGRVLILNRLHALLTRRLAVLGPNDNGRGIDETAADLDFVDRDAGLGDVLLPPLRQGLVHRDQVLVPLAFLLVPVDAEVPGLLDRTQLHALKVEDLGEAQLRIRLIKIQDFEGVKLEDLERRFTLHLLDLLSGHVVNRRLLILHATDVVLEGSELLDALRLGVARDESKELGELRAVRIVLVAAEEQEHLELVIELLEGRLLLRLTIIGLFRGLAVILFLIFVLVAVSLRKLLEHLKHLARKLLRDHLKDLVLLELLAVDVQRQVVRVNNTLNPHQVARQEMVELVRDKHTADVELDVALPALSVAHVHVMGCALRNVQDRAELDVAFRIEVGVRERLKDVLANRLVERLVLLLRNVILGPKPDRLLRVDELPLLRFVVLRLLLIVIVELLVVIAAHLGLRLLYIDRMAHELGVLGHDIRNLVPAQVFRGLLLEDHGDARPAAEGRSARVFDDRERAVRGRLPDVLLRWLVGRDGRKHHGVRDQERGVETDPELPDQPRRILFSTFLHRLQEVRGSRLRDRPKVVNQLLLGHAAPGVCDGERLRLLINLDTHAEFLVLTEVRRIRDRVEASFFQRVTGVGQKLTQEDVLGSVEGVDDDIHQPRNLGLNIVRLRALGHLREVLLAEPVDDIGHLLF